MHRFRKKSDTRRPLPSEDHLLHSPVTVSPSKFEFAPALPALSTGSEFRTSLIFPDLTRQFTAAGLAPSVSETTIRSKLAHQRAHGAIERITEEEEDLMFAALSSIQGFRRKLPPLALAEAAQTSESHYAESVSSSSKSFGPLSPLSPMSPTLLSAFPDTPPLSDLYATPLVSPQSKRNTNNLFGSSKSRDIGAMRSNSKGKAQFHTSPSNQAAQPRETSSDSEQIIFEASKIIDYESSDGQTVTGNGTHLSDKDRTPMARTSRLPHPPRFPNGNHLSVAQVRRMSVALERAISAIVENEGDDDEMILAPHSLPLGGPFVKGRPPTAFNDPSHPIEVSDLNAVLVFLTQSEQARVLRERDSGVTSAAPVTRTPGYVPGMNRPISPREFAADNVNHDSDDYSTTPRATSPVTPFRRMGAPALNRKPTNRPSTAPTRSGPTLTSWSQQPLSKGISSDLPNIIDDYSNDIHPSTAPLTSNQGFDQRAFGRRGPPSPLIQEYQAKFSGRPSTANTFTGGDVRAYSRQPSNSSEPILQSYQYRSDVAGGRRPVGTEQAIVEEHINGVRNREKSSASSVGSPALPESPFVDAESKQGFFGLPSSQSWTPASDQRAIVNNNVVMPQPIAAHRSSRPSTPNLVRSPTPNNVAWTGGPVIPRTETPSFGRSTTPNYLLQRSPSANGFHTDYDYTHENIGKQTQSPRLTPSHTPSNSSLSSTPQYNPLVPSAIGSSSRSSLESTGSSYHSSDSDTKPTHKTVLKMLYNPSANPLVKSPVISGQVEENTKDESHKEDALDSLGDHEDLLELLTGLTKKDLSNIQQKLVSAAVTRDAEVAIRHSQRRRRSSVQSREIVASPTPRPVATNPTTDSESAVMQSQTSVSGSSRGPQSPNPPQVTVEQTLPMAEPAEELSHSPAPVFDPEESFETDDGARAESLDDSIITFPSPHFPKEAEQSPRARALAEALFGKGPSTPLTPLTPSSENSPSVDDLEENISRKAAAATAALKSPSTNTDLGPTLRRKGTKRIDLQQISGPQLVSASMSVDTIPLVSPSMPSLVISPSITESGRPNSGTKLGDRLRRLRGSLRTKPSPTTPVHDNHGMTRTWSQDQTSPQFNQEFRQQSDGQHTIPVYTGTGQPNDPNQSLRRPGTSSGLVSPSGSGGSIRLKGIMAKLRQPKSRKEELLREGIQTQSAGFISSPQLNEYEGAQVYGKSASGEPPSSGKYYNLPTNHPIAEVEEEFIDSTAGSEAALKKLFDAAKSLDIDPEALKDLLERSGSGSSKSTPWSSSTGSRPGTNLKVNEETSAPGIGRRSSNRVKPEATLRPRPAREGGDPTSAVVRRTIIYPSPSGPNQRTSVTRKQSTSSSKRRPISTQSQYSSKSVHDRVPTPPPPRGAKRFSEDNAPPPVPSFSLGRSPPSTRPQTSGSYFHDSENSGRPSVDSPMTDNDVRGEDSRALQVLELANGEVIWSVLDTLRHGPEDFDEENSSGMFTSRTSFASHISGPDDGSQLVYKGQVRSPSRSDVYEGSRSLEGAKSDIKVFYSDAREVARLIDQITRATDGSSSLGSGTPVQGSTLSYSTQSEDLPVEDQLDRLLQRVSEAR